MKRILKQEKGISLISLAVAIIILVIITNILVYNAKDSVHIKNLTSMYNDISNLREKISNYYSIYGDIPAKIKYENTQEIDKLKSAKVIGVNDRENEYYIIELSALEGLTLNLGRDYETIKSMGTITPDKQTQVNSLEDIYIINKNSHNIFYIAGISDGNGKYYYTDDKNIDKAKIDLRYVEGVKIPDGFYYCGGNKQEGIVISDVQGDDLENTKQGNQFVWVPVENFEEFKRQDFREEISNTEFITTQITDGKYYEASSNGKDEGSEVEEMYKSVKINKGFYIARYETGETPSSKKNNVPKTNIKWGDAVKTAENFTKDQRYTSVQSTLCYGVQWDAIMRNLNKGTQQEKEYIKNSTGIGNYKTGGKQTTGNNNYQIKNIYDLAGNVKEWTMEQNGENGKIARGGSYQEQGDTNSVAVRSINNGGTESNDTGYRIALYLNITEGNWSEKYDKTSIYTDREGEQAYIPQGFRVSLSPYQNKISNGLVIKQDETGDEYVWIKVPKEILENRVEDIQIEEALKEYTKEYRQEGYDDIWYNGCGLDQTKYNELKSKMLQSIKTNGGFYIGRYESGLTNPKTSGNISETADSIQATNGLPASQIDKYPYNYITCNQAQNLIQKLEIGNYSTSLMFGIQWDLVCKFLETTQAKTIEQMTKQNGNIGNYLESEFTLTHGKYSTNKGTSWNNVTQESLILKQKNTTALLTTGASRKHSINNIYDIAGNAFELTLEKSNDASKLVTLRGGFFEENGFLTKRDNITINENNIQTSYRVTIF